MLVASFDKKTYAPTLPFEKHGTTGERSFKSILRNSSETGSGAVPNSSYMYPSQGKNCQIQTDDNQPQNITGQSHQKIHLGTLSDDTPTVSELLYSTPYKKNCWEMLESDVNSSKHFKRIPAGTDIYLDKETSEIVWEKSSGRHNERPLETVSGNSVTRGGAPPIYSANLKPKQLSGSAHIQDGEGKNYNTQTALYRSATNSEPSLNKAVQGFMGNNYNKMDCYEMVVGGLEKMGVKYLGKGGLGRHLIDKAIDEGLSRNHYLNGEGLVDATGYSVYNKTLFRVKQPQPQAESAMKEMEKVLKEGQILSFSTSTRGHTGVISKKDGIWTFINSGYMDNNIAGANGEKQVGEEILSKELENWFKLAGNRKEGLKITLGDIDFAKLATYQLEKPKMSKKV